MAADRAWLITQLAASAPLDAWEKYAEPPEQLAGGPCIVLAPRSPYMSWETFSTLTLHLSLNLLVPRTHGGALDLIDTALGLIRDVLIPLPGLGIGTLAQAGTIDEVGGVSYIVASVDVDIEDVPQ